MKSLQVSKSILVYTALFFPKPLYDSTCHPNGQTVGISPERQTSARWLLMGQLAWLVLCFKILALMLTYCQNTFSDKIPAQIKHQNSSPRMIFEKSVVPFKCYLQNVLTTVNSCQRKSRKKKKTFGEWGVLFKWLVAYLKISSQRKLIKKILGRKLEDKNQPLSARVMQS